MVSVSTCAATARTCWITRTTTNSFCRCISCCGEAVQIDPMKTKLKAPGTKRLKQIYNYLLSSVAFNFNFRRYIAGFRFKDVFQAVALPHRATQVCGLGGGNFKHFHVPRTLLQSPEVCSEVRVRSEKRCCRRSRNAEAAWVGRCRLTLGLQRLSTALTGGRAKAWCLRIHAETSVTLSSALEAEI